MRPETLGIVASIGSSVLFGAIFLLALVLLACEGLRSRGSRATP